MRIEKSESGFLLLEVLLAISILSIGATASARVIGESTSLSRRLQETEILQRAKEAVLFKAVNGDYPDLFRPQAGLASGSFKVSETNTLFYEIQSSLLLQSQEDYEITLLFMDSKGKELSRDVLLLRQEPL